MRQINLARLVIFFLIVLLAAGCGGEEAETPEPTQAVGTAAPTNTPEPATPTPAAEVIYGLANVENIDIMILESFPVQVRVLAQGTLPDSCTAIDDTIVQHQRNVFDVAVTTVREPGQQCTDAEEPFEENIPLDVLDLDAGIYSVIVNGVEGSFVLDVDNRIPEEPVEPEVSVPVEVIPETGGTASISGLVWHDLCIVPSPGAEAAEVEEDPRCTLAPAGLQANGQFEDEPGIEGLLVTLGEGPCPSTGAGEATTGVDGAFSFDNLDAGTYCLAIDQANEQNRAILLAGRWTSPESGLAEAGVTLDDAEVVDSINFGWDYLFLPEAGDDPSACTNSFAFIQDLNIPDDTALPPGGEFTKRWLLFNNGTCPWTTGYSILFVGGDFEPSEEETPLAETVVPGQELEVAIDLVAPQETGTYRLNWQIADANGDPFGINAVIEDAFYLRFLVAENAPPGGEALPNSGVIGGVVWDDFCLSNDPGNSCIEFPEDSGFFIADGTYGAAESPLEGITISLASIACPADGSLPPEEAVTATTVTDEDGLYRFENLDQGTYCIFMDALSEENVDFLIPGNWTWPATGVGRYTFFLDPGEQALELDFGWDYTD